MKEKQLSLLTTERTVQCIAFVFFLSNRLMFHSEKQREKRHVRFQLPKKIFLSTDKSQWTNEEFNDRFKRFQCSVTANYWQSLKERVQHSNFRRK